MRPEFPDFKRLELEDRETIKEVLWSYQPQVSEMTFTNLFIWRKHYNPRWSMYHEHLILVAETEARQPFGFMPIGSETRAEGVLMLFHRLKDMGIENPHIERADARLAQELKESTFFSIEPLREHYDYVYSRKELAELSGNKYHSKKNHINAFLKNNSFNFESLEPRHIESCLEMTETWCTLRRCEDDLSLMEEWEATREALVNFEHLGLVGGVITIEDKVEAFALGELLNHDTVVVHVEKANPEIRGLYALINQQCSEKAWGDVSFVNREQDLGNEGLRQAKLSYHPVKLVEKYRIRLM